MDVEVPILCPFSLLFKEELRRTEAGVHSDATPPAEDTAASGPSCLLSPGLSPERGRMTYRFVLTECSSAVWPPNYGRNTQPLALEVSGATRGGAATQLPACTPRGGGGGGEGENSSEPTSSLGLTISANLTGEDKITTEPKRSKQAPASPLLPPSFPPQSLFVVVSCAADSSVFSRQGNSSQFFQSLKGEDRRTSHFPGENSLCLISPSPSPPSALKWGTGSGPKDPGRGGGDSNGTPRPALCL